MRPGWKRISIALLTTLVLAACGGGTTSTPSSGSASSGVMVPDNLKSSGTITFAADMTAAPLQYFDANHNAAGIDIDLCGEVAKHMGLKAKWINLAFNGLIPALNSGRFDAICTEMFIKPDRAAAVNFVPYMQTGTAIATAAGNPHHVASTGDVCGLNAAVQLGTVQESLFKTLSSACTSQGKPAVNIKTFDFGADAVTQLLNGRADLWSADDPEVGYYLQQHPGSVDMVISGINPTPDGIAVAQNNIQLVGAITSALYAMKADGTYDQVMKKWQIVADELAYF